MIKLFPQATTNGNSGADLDDNTDEPINEVADVRAAVAAEQRAAPGDRPWVYSNMVASADGGTAVDGLSGQLGGPADKAMFAALRSVADIIVVGASTARQERYRAPNQRDEVQAERVARGQAPHPRLAIVTRSLELDLDLPLFDDPDNRPYVLTVDSAPAERRERLTEVAEVLVTGETGVDLGTALTMLYGLGARTVLSEGGPSLNGQLIADELIDEWNLSLSPRLLGGDSRRAAIGPLPEGPPDKMSLQRVWTEDDLLFCRWTRRTA
jgi:riboflavin biosynthesis pyrimidine reductase